MILVVKPSGSSTSLSQPRRSWWIISKTTLGSIKRKENRAVILSYWLNIRAMQPKSFWSLITDWVSRIWLAENQPCGIGHFRVLLCLFLKARLRAKPFIWKWILSACEWKLIFIWKAMHEDSLWKRGTRQLGNGLLGHLVLKLLRHYKSMLILWASFFHLAHKVV